jgi:hypothetical protein
MLLSNLKIWDRTKLKLVSNISSIELPEICMFGWLEIGIEKAKVNQNISSIELPEICMFDWLEIGIEKAKVNQISIKPISPPQISSDINLISIPKITSNFCLDIAEITEFNKNPLYSTLAIHFKE